MNDTAQTSHTYPGPYQTPHDSAELPDHTGPKRLTRSDDHWLGGVCGGIGDYLDIDPNVVRLGFVVGAVLGFGLLVPAYALAWILMPKR
ncbi:MAG: PspC domain-containing protein [Nocardioidaceae bacterium]